MAGKGSNEFLRAFDEIFGIAYNQTMPLLGEFVTMIFRCI
jgi:hypothetical protein